MSIKRKTPSLDALITEMSGMIASLSEIHDELKERGVSDLKPLEVVITLLRLAHEKYEVERYDRRKTNHLC